MLYHTELGRGKPEEGEGVNGGTAGITVEIQTFVPQSRFAHRAPRGLIRRPVVPRSLNPHPPFPPPAPAPLGFLRLVLILQRRNDVRICERGGIPERPPFGDVAQQPAHDLSRPRLRQ